MKSTEYKSQDDTTPKEADAGDAGTPSEEEDENDPQNQIDGFNFGRLKYVNLLMFNLPWRSINNIFLQIFWVTKVKCRRLCGINMLTSKIKTPCKFGILRRKSHMSFVTSREFKLNI